MIVAYESTSVPVDRSQSAIRDLLRKHGADQFTFGEGAALDGGRWAGVEFVHDGHVVRVKVPLKPPSERDIAAKARRARTRTADDIRADEYEQEARRIWRVLYHSLKARLVAVEENVETFTEAFLAHLVDPATDRTLWEHVAPAVEAGALRIGGRGLRALTAGTADVVDAEVVE